MPTIEFFDNNKIMIEGDSMSIDDFIDYIYPEDCPERSFLRLKLYELVDAITEI